MSRQLIKSKTFPLEIILLASIIFTIVTMLINIDLPGMYYDDAYFARMTMMMFQNEPETEYAFDTVTIFGWVFPTYIWYAGTITTYLYVPIFAFLEPSNFSMRILGIIINVATLLSTFYFVKEFFDKKTAAVSVVFLATMPAFLFYGKFAGWVSTELFLFFILSMYFLIKWKKEEKTKFLFLAGLAIGLGFSTKLIFLWVIGPLLIFFIIFKIWKKISLKQFLIGVSGFAIGASLLIAYLLKSGVSFAGVILAGSSKTWYGADNTNFASNLALRFSNFNDLISGNSLTMLGGGYGNQIFFTIFIISIIGFIILAKYWKFSKFKRGIFLISSFFIMLAMSTVTLSVFNPAQMLILLPFVPIITALFLGILYNKWKIKNSYKILIVFCGVGGVIVAGNLITVYDYNQVLEETGGIGTFSEQFDNLASFLTENEHYNPIALDWGFTNPIYVLTNGQVKPVEIFGYPDLQGNYDFERFKMRTKNLLNNPENVYLIYSPGFGAGFDRRDLFMETIEKENKEAVLIKEFIQRNGESLIQVYQVK